MEASRDGPSVCPVCWSPLRRGERVCRSCHNDVSVAAPAAATGGRLVPAARAGSEPRTWRRGRWVTIVVGVAALLTALAIKVVSGLLPPPAEYGAATSNVGSRIAVTPHTAVRAVLAFMPAGDVESVGTALAYATQDVGTLPKDAVIGTRPGPDGSQIVSVALRVNVPFLLRVRAIETSLSPNLSNLKEGRLYVSAADDNVYGIVMNPTTHVARFTFRVSASDGTIWADNLNALQVVSQTQALG